MLVFAQASRFVLLLLVSEQLQRVKAALLTPAEVIAAVQAGSVISVYVDSSHCNASISPNVRAFGIRVDMPFVQYMADDMWFALFQAETMVSGVPYHLNTTVTRLREIALRNNGSAAVSETILNPLTSDIIHSNTIDCLTGIKTDSAVQFRERNAGGKSLDTFSALRDAIEAGSQLSFAVDLHWCPPYLPEIVQPIWGASISEYAFSETGDMIFSKSFSWLDNISVMNFTLHTSGNVSVSSFAQFRKDRSTTKPFMKHCILGENQTFSMFQH